MAAVATVGGLYWGVHGALLGLSVWAERHADSYPWRSEDYLRYLIPTLFGGDGENRILLVGPSEAREDLLYEKFDAAFPQRRAIQAGLSLGTFHDLLLALDYWEATFGSEAIPRTLVLGVTVRWVANIPRGESPLSQTITRYSQDFRTVQTVDGPRLEPKGLVDRPLSFKRLLGKQPARYRAALCSLAWKAIGAEPLTATYARGELLRSREVNPALRGPLALLDECRSPYKYHQLEPMDPQVLRDWMRTPTSFWSEGHRWDPAEDSAMIAREFDRLRAKAERLGIDVYIVNLPEHPANRAEFDPAAYALYEKLLAESIQGWPVLDLRTLLPEEQFYDVGHATAKGALKVTAETIQFIRSVVAARADSGPTPSVVRSASRRPSPETAGGDSP